jgi:hypothetical protein
MEAEARVMRPQARGHRKRGALKTHKSPNLHSVPRGGPSRAPTTGYCGPRAQRGPSEGPQREVPENLRRDPERAGEG